MILMLLSTAGAAPNLFNNIASLGVGENGTSENVTITWTPNPLAIIVSGTALGANLDATATDPTAGNPVAGSFVYTDETGTVVTSTNQLSVGPHQMTATFTPTDIIDYTSGGTIQNSIIVTPQSPAMTITKSANLTSYSAVGQVIGYTYTVTNTGNVDMPEPITINDNKIPGGQVIIGSSGNMLAPGKSVQGSGIYTVTQHDLNTGSVINSATATTLFCNQPITSNSATATVPAIQNPALSITKSASPTTYDKVGQTITYTYTVTNTGNVDILGDIMVTDDHISSLVTISNSDLPPGHSVTGTATYKITDSDIDTCCVTNSAYATNNNIKSNTDTAKVTCEKANNEEENNGEPWNGGPGYGGALVPMPMYGSPMYGSEPSMFGSETSTTAVPNSESNVCKGKVSSSKCHNGKCALSKHNHKNHSKHHKAEKNHSKHHKAGKNHFKHHKTEKNS